MGEASVLCMRQLHPLLDPHGQLLLHQKTLFLYHFEWISPRVIFRYADWDIRHQSHHDDWDGTGRGIWDVWSGPGKFPPISIFFWFVGLIRIFGQVVEGNFPLPSALFHSFIADSLQLEVSLSG